MIKHYFWWGIIVSIIFTLVFFINFIPNIDKPFPLDHGDAYHLNFILKHVVSSIKSGDLSQLANPPMFYGFKNTLFFSDNLILQALLALPLSIFMKDPILLYNSLTLFTLASSFFFMFLFTFYLTKNFLASAVASLIFTFNPYVMAHFPDHLQLFSLQWIPLIFLFLEKLLKNKSNLNIFLFFLALVFQILSSLYYAAYLFVILTIYIIIRINQEKIPLVNFLKKGFIGGLLLLIITATSLGFVYYNAISKYPDSRNLAQEEEFHSAWVTDWLLAGSRNFLYGNFREKALKLNSTFFHEGSFEQSLFWGIIPIILLLLSFYLVRKYTERKIWKTFLIVLTTSLILSFGPKINISSEIKFPGSYALLEKIDPILSYMRVPSRFAVFTFFSLAIICSLVIKRLSDKVSAKMKWAFLLIIFLLIFEYWNLPLGHLEVSDEVRNFYKKLNEQQDIQIIANLPMGQRAIVGDRIRFTNPDSVYLLWATMFHDKKLLNGYSGFIPKEYLERALILESDYPISAKIQLLRKWGVEGLILHKDEFFRESDYQSMKLQIMELGIPLITSTNNLVLFDLTKAEQSE